MRIFLVKLMVCLIVLATLFVGVLRIGCFLYPKDYELTVRKFAKMYDVPQELVFSVIKAESNYNEKAVSSKGAVGLMQIMEPTGKWAAEKMGKEEFSKELLYDPVINIQIGCFYLSYLMDLYEGNLENALAAYNAGPTNVDKWLEDKAYSKNGKNLTHIPFSETKDYVKKVMRNIKIYDFLY